ncbi:MAG: sigma-70 family RNA polymerase sigma factor [Planctomycetota bacterium]
MTGSGEELDALQRASYEQGRAAHPGLDLAWEAYSARLLALIDRRFEAGASGGPHDWIRELPAADFFLVCACEEQVSGCWERLDALYRPPIRSSALSWGASPAEADEIAAGLAGDLLPPPASRKHATQLGGYDGTGSLLGYIARIVRHRRIDGARRKTPETLERPDAEPASGESPYERLISSENGQRVAAAFEDAVVELSPADFEILKLHFGDGVAQSEIARRLDVTPPRVNYRLHRSLSRVRDAMLEKVADETSAYWLSRRGQATVLKDVIARILATGRDPRL